MDGLYLLGFGPRTATAARDLAGDALSGAVGREAAVRAGRRTNAGVPADDRGRAG